MSTASLADQAGLGPAHVRALIRFAEREARTGRLHDAIETLRVAIVLEPREIEAWEQLGRCYDAIGDAPRSGSAARVAARIRAAQHGEVTS